MMLLSLNNGAEFVGLSDQRCAWAIIGAVHMSSIWMIIREAHHLRLIGRQPR